MKTVVSALIALTTLTACATTQDTTDTASGVSDPFEGFNRNVYAFNEAVDKAAIEPVARGYRAVVPEPARDGVHNVLTNIRQPVVFANSMLQGNAQASADTFGRFLINSTIGVAGIFDVASTLGVTEHNEDFGQTLGVWGVEPGPFLVLPLLGPSNFRDTFGIATDRALDPLTWTEFESDPDLDDHIAVGRTVLGLIDTRARLIEPIETLRSQPEPYIALRRNYSSQREAAIRNGETEADPYQDLPDFDVYDEESAEGTGAGDQ
ncbi:MAG: VacJ family lipoprotein [Henriciella sp.]|uniref:MlaA family lipoprotein n=1 Tax=Henriciella sp. TaxID=1968823 RepID=UPI000C0EE7C6|nr:VacJ family lipoprotein [Henriciella sp.]MAN72482.1 VacJ family lipoprotein [Henriciella sp.]MBF32960.1 VacJ family lipoprotein [Hyphomonadaceae bacterium]MBK74782.1 VacJ family lipoprotein [Henriciella sp.]PHR77127.1 MAG: VacJ family lipoprotein [Henriciella sp.]